jgi:hypothetical protein
LSVVSAAIASVTWLDLLIKKEDRPLDGGPIAAPACCG